MAAIVRKAWTRFGLEKSQFYNKYVWKPGGSETVTGTKDVPRLRPAMPGCFFDDELDAVIEGIRAERDAEPLVGKTRDAGGKFTATLPARAKERA